MIEGEGEVDRSGCDVDLAVLRDEWEGLGDGGTVPVGNVVCNLRVIDFLRRMLAGRVEGCCWAVGLADWCESEWLCGVVWCRLMISPSKSRELPPTCPNSVTAPLLTNFPSSLSFLPTPSRSASSALLFALASLLARLSSLAWSLSRSTRSAWANSKSASIARSPKWPLRAREEEDELRSEKWAWWMDGEEEEGTRAGDRRAGEEAVWLGPGPGEGEGTGQRATATRGRRSTISAVASSIEVGDEGRDGGRSIVLVSIPIRTWSLAGSRERQEQAGQGRVTGCRAGSARRSGGRVQPPSAPQSGVASPVRPAPSARRAGRAGRTVGRARWRHASRRIAVGDRSNVGLPGAIGSPISCLLTRPLSQQQLVSSLNAKRL